MAEQCAHTMSASSASLGVISWSNAEASLSLLNVGQCSTKMYPEIIQCQILPPPGKHDPTNDNVGVTEERPHDTKNNQKRQMVGADAEFYSMKNFKADVRKCYTQTLI